MTLSKIYLIVLIIIVIKSLFAFVRRKKMNIGFVSLENPYSKNNNGGIGTYTGIMMKALSAKGHKVCFFTIGKEKDYRVRNTNIFVIFDLP